MANYIITNNGLVNADTLSHHGVKGMKWGKRKAQNKEGSLSTSAQKRISKKYRKIATKASMDLYNNSNSIYVKGYNKTADEMNNGGIDKFNESQRKKYGAKYAERKGYDKAYENAVNKVLTKNLNQVRHEFMTNNKYYKKSKKLVDKYGMTKWDDLARDNEAAITELRRAVEKGV